MKLLKKMLLLLLAAGVIVVFLGYEVLPFRNGEADPALRSEPAAETALPVESVDTPAPIELPVFTLRFVLPDGSEETRTVVQGESPETPDTGSGFLYWADETGNPVSMRTLAVTADRSFTAVTGPALVSPEDGWFPGERDGLFHPEHTLTRGDLAVACYGIFQTAPTGETFLNDVLTNAHCYKAATALVTAGYMELSSGAFRPDQPVTGEELSFLLKQLMDNDAVDAFLADHEGDSFTRGEVCALMVSCLPESERTEDAYFPDVRPEDPCYAAVSAAGLDDGSWLVDGQKRTEGFVNREGWLYYIDADGYFRKDTDIGTLHFDSTGRFTSGSEELDGYVAGVIADCTGSREQLLRAVYNYVRDKNLYLRGELYELYKTGWEIDEALKLFTKGRGNCYSFASEFWALARGLGYDAKVISGTIGNPYGENGQNPHGWVEIEMDGTMYIFDVETEAISYRATGDYNTSFFKITYERGEGWSYVRDSSCKYAPEAEAANAERFAETSENADAGEETPNA